MPALKSSKPWLFLAAPLSQPLQIKRAFQAACRVWSEQKAAFSLCDLVESLHTPELIGVKRRPKGLEVVSTHIKIEA